MTTVAEHTTPKTPSEDVVPLKWFDEYLAGVNYDERSLVVCELSLRERVILKRELTNLQDANAIRVETLKGRPVGYLRRELAALLAKPFDNLARPVDGIVTELSCDADGASYRVRVKFSLPPNCFDLTSLNQLNQAIEYFYDDSGVKTYVLLNCSDDLFAQVREKLAADQIPFTKHGLCYRPAKKSSAV